MLIRHFMSTPVYRVESTETIESVWDQLQDLGLRRLVVTRHGRAVGVVSEHDLVRALPRHDRIGAIESAPEREDAPVGSLLKHDLVTIGPNDHIDDAAARMLEHRIDTLPVIEGGELVGILTSSDIFRLFAKSEADKSAATRRVTIEWPASEPEPDPLRAVFAAGGRLHGLVRHRTPGGVTVSVLHLANETSEEVQKRLVAMGFVVVEKERGRGRR